MAFLSLDIFPNGVVPLDPPGDRLIHMIPKLLSIVIRPNACILLSFHHFHHELGLLLIFLPLPLLQPLSFLQCDLILSNPVFRALFIVPQLLQTQFHGI
jgi:hypothetical protein